MVFAKHPVAGSDLERDLHSAKRMCRSLCLLLLHTPLLPLLLKAASRWLLRLLLLLLLLRQQRRFCASAGCRLCCCGLGRLP